MFQRILVPLDGSPLAEQALPLAAHIAHVSQASLTLIRIVVPSIVGNTLPTAPETLADTTREIDLSEAKRYLKVVAGSEILRGVSVQAEALTGAPAQTTLLFAKAQQHDLIVLCSHGDTGIKRWLFGSMALELIRHSHVPVLVLRAGGPSIPTDASRPVHVLVPLDGTPLAEAALVPAAQLCTVLASPGNGTIHLIYVFRPLPDVRGEEETSRVLNEQSQAVAQAYLESIEQRFTRGELAEFKLIATSSLMLETKTAETAQKVAEEAKRTGNSSDEDFFTRYDLIAMATHARSGLARLIMGSFTEDVLDATRQPLLVVHQAPEVHVF